MRIKRSTVLSTAIILCGAIAQVAARADSNTFTLTSIGNDPQVNVSSDGGASFIQTWAGEYSATLGSQDINVFCIDYDHDIPVGGTYEADTNYGLTDGAGIFNGTYYEGGMALALTDGDIIAYYPAGDLHDEELAAAQNRADEIGYLMTTYTNATDNTFLNDASGSTSYSANMAAVGLSVWDIEEDGGSGITGEFQGDTATQAAYGSLVSYYEAQAAAQEKQTFSDIRWVQAPQSPFGTHQQDFSSVIVGSYSPNSPVVPEASSVVSFAALLGCLGLMMMRSRKSGAANKK